MIFNLCFKSILTITNKLANSNLTLLKNELIHVERFFDDDTTVRSAARTLSMTNFVQYIVMKLVA